MLRQLRLDTWWPGQTKDVRDFVDSCDFCAAGVAKNYPAPMTERETPDGPWQHVSADFKGPIGGQYYFHLLIDNYSRWPEVEIVKTTSLDKLKPALDKSLDLLGIPESITHDNGPPYNSVGWRSYAKERGFETRACTPEHPEGNAIAERFMGVLVKTVHTAVAAGRDPKVEVGRRLLNYRNTPHPSTGKTPAELMFGRRLKTKVPSLRRTAQGQIHEEAKAKDQETRQKRKETFDKSKRAVLKEITAGDKVLIKQQKTTLKPPYDPKPFTVTKVKAAQVTAERGSKLRIRDMSRVKLLKKRPVHLRRNLDKERFSDSDSDDDYLDLSKMMLTPVLEQRQEALIDDIQEQEEGQQEPGQIAEQDPGQMVEPERGQLEEPATTRPRRNKKPTIKILENLETDEVTEKQLSPKQRKKAKATARQRTKTQAGQEEEQDEILNLE
jgi:hypothetical protein